MTFDEVDFCPQDIKLKKNKPDIKKRIILPFKNSRRERSKNIQ
jgi:hypothetical protein